MWRFVNSIPRALRQHLHGPRTSTVLLEEEVDQEVEKCTFRRKSLENDEAHSAGVCDGQADENQCHEDSCSNKTGREDYEWWRTCHFSFWSLFNRSHQALEAVAWGTGVCFGKQYGLEQEYRKRRPWLLYRMLFALPSGQRAIRDTEGAARDSPRSLEESKKETETLEDVMEDFKDMCNKYVALGKSIMGLQAAEKGDMSVAVDHMAEACHRGQAAACFNLGLCYETGNGVKRDLVQAAKYYKKAGEANHSSALFNLALLHVSGEGGVARDNLKADSLLEKAARLGLAEAQTCFGCRCMEEKGERADEAVHWFQAAAEQNDSEAQFFLGMCYEQGLGVEVNECKAAQLYSQAASAGHEGAMYNLAVYNECGQGGLPADEEAAVELYQRAADLGSEPASIRLQELHSMSVRRDGHALAGQTKLESPAISQQPQTWQAKVKETSQLDHHPQKAEQPPGASDHGVVVTACERPSLSPSFSSPSLTECFALNLADLLFPGALTPDDRPRPTSPPRSSGWRSRPLFTLGSDGSEEDSESSFSDPESPRSELFVPASHIHRTATMPNLFATPAT